MGHEVLLDLAKSTLMTALMICAPALLVGMCVGLLISLFQTCLLYTSPSPRD